MKHEILIEAGIDVDDFLERVMGKENLLRRFMGYFIKDANFEALKKAIAEKDTDGAVNASHSLKGVCGNLSMKELYALFTKQVELLRSGEFDSAAEMMPEITEKHEIIVRAINTFLSEET